MDEPASQPLLELQTAAVTAFGSERAQPVVAAIALLTEHEHPAATAAGLETTRIIHRLGLDPDALAAALVHELHRIGELDDEALTKALGPAVQALSAAVLRLDRVHWSRIEEEAAESLRKMFLAMASDPRVVLIALAGRVHLMRNLGERPEDERLRRASETMDVYAPLANRLGVWQLKWELEDLAFKFLEPQTFRELKQKLAEKRQARAEAVVRIQELLGRRLSDAGIEASITGRPKHIYSIYKKMRRKKVAFEQIYDVNAVRIIVPKIEDCYAALGLVHGLWTPIAGEFDDYIAKPKENFYRSLHTAVVGPGGQPLEIQIRTQEMHDYNEFGVAAHWRYKELKKADRAFDDKINWLRQLLQWQHEVVESETEAGAGPEGVHDVAETLKSDVFADQVYVFTPTGDVVDLPQGATPVDFAYRIHTQVGHRCRGAKVNGQIVPLHHELHTGDRVEIITAKKGGPSRDWLNPHLGQVHSSSARQKIRQYFRQQEREPSIAAGRDIVERELKRLGIDAKRLEELPSLYPQYQSLDDVLAGIGFGDISSQSVGARLLELERAAAPPALPELPSTPPPQPQKKQASAVSMAGIEDVLSSPARCCNPVPGDPVVGFITRGRGVVIHRRDCPNYINHPEPERWMELSWGQKAGTTYPVQIQVLAYDRKALLHDITEVIATEGINMTSTSAKSTGKDDTCLVEATLQIRNSEQVLRLLSRLQRLPDVLSARRVRA